MKLKIMPLIESQRGKLFYRDFRKQLQDQVPLLLVHGAGASYMDWPVQLRRHPEAQVITPDLSGHGDSPGSGHDHIGAYVEDLLALMDALEIEKAIVGGHSMGGAIAQTMALNAPDRVVGLLLVATGAHLPVNPLILDGLQTDTEATVRRIIRWSWAKSFSDEWLAEVPLKRLLTVDPTVTRNDYAACAAFDVREQLGSIQAPTLIVAGEVDKMTPLAHSEVLAAGIPDADLVVIEGGGHMLALEQPEIFTKHVIAWLRRLRSPGHQPGHQNES